MPRPTIIKRVVNALATQHRIILHLECGHNESVTLRQVQMMEGEPEFDPGDEFLCPYCPDPPRTDAVAQEPTARDAFDALFKSETGL